MAARSEAFFATPRAGSDSQRYALWHSPVGRGATAVVVYIHPFAEEMNKSRRMAALQSRALAHAGCAVLQIDLLGCGDSAGDFGDASWGAWLDDVNAACDLALARFNLSWPGQMAPALWLWGLRAGCLLATATAARRAEPWNLLLWQPPASGKAVLQQFLRLKTLADLQGADVKAVAEKTRHDLAAGLHVDVAGYRLAPALAQGLDQAKLAMPSGQRQVLWAEVSPREGATLLPVSAAAVDAWRQAGHDVDAVVVTGPAFWSTLEIEDAPALIQATTQRVAGLQGRMRGQSFDPSVAH